MQNIRPGLLKSSIDYTIRGKLYNQVQKLPTASQTASNSLEEPFVSSNFAGESIAG